MSVLSAVALAFATTTTTPIDCSWDQPGVNPYTGSIAAAIDRYPDLPDKVRASLKYRLQYGNPDDTVTITRDAITGGHTYDAAIRDMHFGKDQLCHTVSRARWSPRHTEPGAVYCADGHCILVPQICGNVSRIVRRDGRPAGGPELGSDGRPEAQRDPRQMPPSEPPAVAARQPVEKTPEIDWTGHVGTYELGLIDAPEQDDERVRVMLGTPVLPPAWAPVADYAALPHKPRQLAGTRGPVTDQPATPVPEAGTWTMLLAGLGLIGCLRVRRRRRR
ncbi:hypothetical protein ASF61_07505 [Duganella sp. Leaf126]|uniref:MHFG family PEP-CTERM protein n=1 Tax=Duganella sp. Leaf126 TaxID=1736266 RepID=UPI0006F70BCD|nr:MHFG family PEP-CTERM protein [Duganella sp. Leaf126]KQQ36046.1 hypothetical protein ASF61_07505 [Duganella sp. Leaf126]